MVSVFSGYYFYLWNSVVFGRILVCQSIVFGDKHPASTFFTIRTSVYFIHSFSNCSVLYSDGEFEGKGKYLLMEEDALKYRYAFKWYSYVSDEC